MRLFIGNPGADSLDRVELMMAFEETSLQLPDEVAGKLVTVHDAVLSVENFCEVDQTVIPPWSEFQETADKEKEILWQQLKTK